VSEHICYKHHTQGFIKYSSKLILAQNSEMYTHFASELLNAKKLFHSDANSLTLKSNEHDQNTLRFVRFSINMPLRWKKLKKI
jgi:hypothetical protein